MHLRDPVARKQFGKCQLLRSQRRCLFGSCRLDQEQQVQTGEEGIEGLKGAGLSMPEGVGIQSGRQLSVKEDNP